VRLYVLLNQVCSKRKRCTETGLILN